MAALVLGVVGAVIGGIVGGPAGAQIGFAIGSAAGSVLFPPEGPTVEGPRINDLAVQQSAYGAVIPRIYGRYRLAGNIIWATDIVEHRHEEQVGGKGGGGETSITYTYTTSFATSMCEGEIAAVLRIWADNKIIYDARDNLTGPRVNFDADSYTIYYGTETQMPDPTMEAAMGVGNVPAYRGQAIIVFNSLQLKPYGNRIPNMTFEVVRTGDSSPSVINTTFTTDPTHGGELTAYNPILNEVWNFIPSTFEHPFSGVCRRSISSFTELGDIDSTGTSGASSLASGVFGKPQFDAVKGRMYIMGEGPDKILKFDAAAASFLGRIDWPSGFSPSYWAVDPTDGTIWGTNYVSGTPKLQQVNPDTNALLTNVTAPGGPLDMVIDQNGVVWQFGGYDLYKYDGSFSVALHDDDGVMDAIYDPDNHAIWYTTFPDYDSSKWHGAATITNISNGNPAIVTYTGHYGQPFVTGQSVSISAVTGMDQLFPDGSYGQFHFTLTAIDSTHFSIPVDTTLFNFYTSGGLAETNSRRLKRYDIASDTVDLVVDVDSYGFGETKNLVFDPYRHLVWVFNQVGASLTGVRANNGQIANRIAFTPNNYPWWVSPAPTELWVNDSTFEEVNRIRFTQQFTPGVWTVGMVVADISYSCGMTSDQINVDALTMPIRGYGLTNDLTGRGAIEALMRAYMFDSVDSDGKVKYVLRGARPVVRIDSDELVNQQ